MATPEEDVRIADNPSESRFELTVGDEPAGTLDYRFVDGRIVLAYVEVDPRFGGRGLGGRLTEAVLRECRARELPVSVECPFIARYIRLHPEHADLLS